MNVNKSFNNFVKIWGNVYKFPKTFSGSLRTKIVEWERLFKRENTKIIKRNKKLNNNL